MNLYNALPTSSGIRLCYWHPEYHSECQPFYASKMTEQENRAFFALEDLLALEAYERTQAQALGSANLPLGGWPTQGEELTQDGQSLRLKTGKKDRNTYFLEKKFLPGMAPAGCGSCNTHNNAGTPSKSTINRRDFLAR